MAVLLLGTGTWAGAAQAQAAQGSKPTPAPININTATVAQLGVLPGIGPKTAQRIVDYRQKNGSFKKIEELMNVKGIGEKGFLKLKPLITAAAPKAGNLP
ncbi:MAG: helix-hairpin-helix domain-containing protein [Acidobacteria bacterium]|nr:helix-hairpin-helix domain-containing protein [Acidobacteriota bacterium]